MATAMLSGNLRDFTGDTITGAHLWVHPLQSSAGGFAAFADRPINVEIESSGNFSVPLEEENRYRLEVIFPAPGQSRVGRSEIGEFRMPVGGGYVGQLIGPPADNGMVRVLQGAPGSTILDQYVYDETTGDLYERTS